MVLNKTLRSEWRFRAGPAATLPCRSCFLGVEPVTANEFLQGDADDTANRVQFEQVQSTNAVLILADDGLAHPERDRQFLLAESGFFANGTQQGEQDVLPFPATAQSWSALPHETKEDKGLAKELRLSHTVGRRCAAHTGPNLLPRGG